MYNVERRTNIMKILLHICCAPCAVYSIQKLRDSGNDVEGFFYNPNIHPLSEYENRKKSCIKLSEATGVKVFFCNDYRFEDFFRKITFHENDQRCSLCWALRLNKAAEYASKNGFDGFTSTLFISPYQDHQEMKAIALKAQQQHSVAFFYDDFRPGFRESHRLSKEMGLYHQKYCGCIYSERERSKKTYGREQRAEVE